MLQRQFPLKVKFICALIYSDQKIYNQTLKLLKKKFGPIDYISPVINFNYTEYYKKEMGERLLRSFISFEKLIDPAELLNRKLYALKLENKFSVSNHYPKDCLPSSSFFSRYFLLATRYFLHLQSNRSRIINIDPGYINDAKLVLSSTKDFHHRIYLGKGIFAEITLAYSAKEKTFTDFPTTFPDYRTKEYKDILIHIRNLYRAQLKP